MKFCGEAIYEEGYQDYKLGPSLESSERRSYPGLEEIRNWESMEKLGLIYSGR